MDTVGSTSHEKRTEFLREGNQLDDVRRVTEYLFPRWIDLIARGWQESPQEMQQEQIGEVVGPLLDLVPARTLMRAFRYVVVLTTLYGADGNISLTARSLDIHRSTLARILKEMQRAGINFSATLLENFFIRRHHA